MNLRIHLALLVVLVVAHTVSSSIESPAAKQVSGVKAKTQDDLYIDDEGDDDIQLQDEASGSGPSKPRDSRVEADLEEEEEEEEEDEEEDEEDSVPVVVEANKAKDVAPPVGVSSSDFKEDDAPSPPKVSPVAASPSFPAAKPVHDDDDEDEDEDYNVQGSGAGSTGGSRGTGTSVGRDGGSGAGSISGVDDEDEEEEDYDDTSDVEDIDINSVITEPETPRPPVKPEKKPEVVVVAPPAPQPTKAPVDRGIPTAPTTVTTPPMIEVRSEKAPSTTEQPSSTSTTARAPIIGSGDRAGADPGSDVHIDDHKPEDRPTSFFAQPGILAAVIGGAVVGLLCAILLVMFIVYRMRKKDEGSYVLDEPKRSSPNSHPYNKNSREFYA